MPNLTASPGKTDVPQLETSTPALGGPGAPMNAQAQALLNRTEDLYQQAASMLSQLSALIGTVQAHIADTTNVHAVTKAQLGLGSVDNTADAHKPVSQAQQVALDAKANKVIAVDSRSGADHVLLDSDALKYLRISHSTPATVTVPHSSTVDFPIGTTIHVRQTGEGQITFVAADGVVINTPSTLSMRAQGSTVTVLKVAANQWDLYGDLED